jgi:hypothetical protein
MYVFICIDKVMNMYVLLQALPWSVLGPKGVIAARKHVSHVGKAPIRLASSVHKCKQGLVFLFVGCLSDWRRKQTLGRSHRGLSNLLICAYSSPMISDTGPERFGFRYLAQCSATNTRREG